MAKDPSGGKDEGGGNDEARDENPLALVCDIDDWQFARRRLDRVVERLGRGIPPSGPGPAAELAQIIAALDVEIARERDVWDRLIRPRLAQYEDAPIPPLTFL